MFSTLLTVALFLAPAIRGVFADFAVNSPALVQCQSAKISWAPTKGPYNVIVVAASDPCGDALANVGDFDTTSTSWIAAIPAGTVVQLSVLDADENEAWSNNITVGPSSDTSCLPGAASATPAADNTPGTPAASTPTDSGDDSTPSVAPVGAANAGADPFASGAISARQASTPLLAIAGLVAVFSLL